MITVKEAMSRETFCCAQVDNFRNPDISECSGTVYFGKIFFVPWGQSEVTGKLQAIHIQRALLYHLQMVSATTR